MSAHRPLGQHNGPADWIAHVSAHGRSAHMMHTTARGAQIRVGSRSLCTQVVYSRKRNICEKRWGWRMPARLRLPEDRRLRRQRAGGKGARGRWHLARQTQARWQLNRRP
jgi:hypothetical protein